jgi:hypothetical protein
MVATQRLAVPSHAHQQKDFKSPTEFQLSINPGFPALSSNLATHIFTF